MKAQRAAMNRMAPRCKAPHIKATRTAHWKQWVFRVVLAQMHGTVSHLAASQAGARQGTEFQSNADCPLETAGFPSRFGSGAAHRKASQCIADHCKAHQSNADCPLATVGFPSRVGAKARHGIASSCVASWRKAGHGISKQRGLPTGNSGFSESFWLECEAAQGSARKGCAAHRNSKQRAPRSGNRPLCRSLWPTGWVFIRSFTNLNVKEFQL